MGNDTENKLELPDFTIAGQFLDNWAEYLGIYPREVVASNGVFELLESDDQFRFRMYKYLISVTKLPKKIVRHSGQPGKSSLNTGR